MAFSPTELANIANDLLKAVDNIGAANKALEQTAQDKKDLQGKADGIKKLFYDTYDNNIKQYHTELGWISGTLKIDLNYSTIIDSAQRVPNNMFFPDTWKKFTPKWNQILNGLAPSINIFNEDGKLNYALELDGILAMISFIKNGSPTGQTAQTLNLALTNASTSIQLDSGTFTIGSYLMISGSGTSALVKVTGGSGVNLNITQIVQPANTIAIGGNVIATFAGFSNVERQNLNGGTYDNVLDVLATRIDTKVQEWENILIIQLNALNANTDTPADTLVAVTSINNAKTDIDTWQALAQTGVSGRFTDTSILIITNRAATRNSFRPIRVAAINKNLGTSSQDADGNILGNALYLNRFKTISMLINITDGPLTKFYIADLQKDTAKQQVSNENNKKEVYSTRVKVGQFSANPTGTNVVKLSSAAEFTIGDKVLVIGGDNPFFAATITNKSGNTITLDKPVSEDYQVGIKSGITKEV